jgi:hypothetical protein
MLQRNISPEQITLLARWLDTEPEVPESKWFKKFPGSIVCGEAELIKKLLLPGKLPAGRAIERPSDEYLDAAAAAFSSRSTTSWPTYHPRTSWRCSTPCADTARNPPCRITTRSSLWPGWARTHACTVEKTHCGYPATQRALPCIFVLNQKHRFAIGRRLGILPP